MRFGSGFAVLPRTAKSVRICESWSPRSSPRWTPRSMGSENFAARSRVIWRDLRLGHQEVATRSDKDSEEGWVMKAVVGSVVAGVVASACWLGPVLFATLGAGALGAASIRLEPYRHWFIGLTAWLLGAK